MQIMLREPVRLTPLTSGFVLPHFVTLPMVTFACFTTGEPALYVLGVLDAAAWVWMGMNTARGMVRFTIPRLRDRER